MSVTVLDKNNNPMPVGVYNNVKVRMLDTDNREVDTSGFVIGSRDSSRGRILIGWPDYVIFNRPGEYVMQLVLETNDGKTDFTTERTIVVKSLGGK
jgi:hypothetical protein